MSTEALGRLNRSQTQAQTRRRLLDAARAIVVREGSGAVTVARVAEDAGYTTGAVYSNFKGGRGELLLALSRELASSLAVTPPTAAGGEAWLSGLAAVLADHTDNRAAVALATEMMAIALRDPDVRRAAVAEARDSRDSIQRAMEQSDTSSEVFSSQELALLVMSLFAGLAQYRSLLGSDEVPVELCVRAFAALGGSSADKSTRPRDPRG